MPTKEITRIIYSIVFYYLVCVYAEISISEKRWNAWFATTKLNNKFAKTNQSENRFGEAGIMGLGVVLYRIDYAGVKDFTSFDE